MKKINKLIIAPLALIFVSIAANAQNEYDSVEDLTYEPIHQTIFPSDNRLHIEEVYEKNKTIALIGDELSIKLNAKKGSYEPATAVFELPIDPRQDYEVEYNFTASNLKKSIFSTSINNFILFLIGKSLVVKEGETTIFESKKWSMPSVETKNGLIVKFERRKNIITIFINGKYVCEKRLTGTNINKTVSLVGIAPLGGKAEVVLNSIRLEQGAEVVEE